MKSLRTIIFLLLSVLLISACVYPLDDPRSGGNEAGKGRLVLSFKTGAEQMATKAEGPLNDGFKFKNMLVILTDENGKVIKNSNLVTPDQAVSSQEIEFTGLAPGNYHAYAYANIRQTAWQDASNLIMNTERNLSEGNDYLNVDRLMKTLSASETLKALYEQDVDDDGDTPMLLTGNKAVSVGIQVNHEEIELLRPIVRLNVTVYNHTMYPIHVDQLSFNDFNVSASYLIGRLDNGTPVIPEVAQNRPLPSFQEKPVGDPAYWITHDASQLVYSEFLYENTAVNYKIYATMTMDVQDGEGHSTGQVQKSIQYKGAELIPASKILGMAVDEEMQVIMTTPNNTEGLFVGRNATTNKMLYKQATATDEASYQKWAQDILNDPVDRANYVMTLRKTNEQDGKGNYYYKLFHQEGASEYNILPQEKVIIAEGTRVANTPTNSNYINPPGFVHHLIQIWNKRGSGEQVLCPDGKSPNTTLKFKANNNTGGNRRWAFYAVDPDGTVLKLIDNKTNQVSRLTQMVRNQELNVVINVYYSVEIGDFDFKVENAYWSGGEHEHESGHTFE